MSMATLKGLPTTCQTEESPDYIFFLVFLLLHQANRPVPVQCKSETASRMSTNVSLLLLVLVLGTVLASNEVKEVKVALQKEDNKDEGMMAAMVEFFGLDECWEMAICDAHARYDDYGVLAMPVVLFFPG